jgi:dihydropteroate synthase
VDTSKAKVAERAIAVGATVVNDVTALGDPAMGPLCAATGVQLVVMHMRGTPRTMQADTRYTDLISEVEAHLALAAQRAITAGVPVQRIVIDPGLGFGKALKDNTALIRAVPRLCGLGYRVLIGASRKRFIGAMTHEDAPDRRVMGSVGAALAAAAGGASIVRVHDVRATIQALEVFWACKP